MAGRGTRLRPQTLTTPKPLIEVAGKTIIERIVNIVENKIDGVIDNIGFVIDQPNKKTENMLKLIGKKNKTKAHIFYQHKAEGTAHAIYCAKKILKGPTLIIFADTLFETEDLSFSKDSDGHILVKEVKNPSAYGVVRLNNNGEIIEFIEKPKSNISNLAIVGIYYFKEGLFVAKEIESILEKKIMIHGEYQITTVLENLKNKKKVFTPHKIKEWFDFGTPMNLLNSHKEILKRECFKEKKFKNTKIKPPCCIADDVIIEDSTIGPNVSVGKGTTIKSSSIQNTIIQSNSKIIGAKLQCSIIGNNVEYKQSFTSVNIGDYSTFK